MTPPSIEVLNKLLPAYRFLDFIAQGGMGAVYLANQLSLDRKVALKILPRELSSDPEFRASFQTEARAMAKLNHPNLISIYDSGDVDGMLYIAMEYVPGKSLYHSSWNKKIDVAEASRIIIAICEGLRNAHDNGIIHRDIKPANILLTPRIEPKIGDFGLAQAVGSKHEGVVMGTPGYTAPEIISHPEKADRRSDLFAVGVMLHELLTGQKPEDGVKASDLCKCGTEFDKVIARAIHPNPVMRYPDANSMILAIQEALKKPEGPVMQTAPAPATMLSKKAQPMARPVVQSAAAAAMSGTPAKVISPSSPMPEEDEEEEDSLPELPKVVVSGSSWSYIRNLLIIAGLLVVCVFVYQKLQIHKENTAKREIEYARKQAEEDMRRRRDMADELEKEKIASENEKNTTQNEIKTTEPGETPPPIIPKEEPKKETAMESLLRLKYDLSKGDREQMPIGTIRRGELDFFLVADPMTFDHAMQYAEEHGGHIALPKSEDDYTFLQSLLKNNETIWMGAGRSGRDQWLLLDGTPWSIAKTPVGGGNFASLSSLGNVKATEASRKLPFVISWHRDGSNPSSLDQLLQNARNSLDSPAPTFPPGTLVAGSRHFLPVLRPMSYKKAKAYAEQAGAHVAALSTKDEGFWIDALEEADAPRGIWLGGEKNGGVWQWATKEPWTYARWAPDSPEDDEEATLLVYLPKKGWHNVNADEEVDGVLLEWSKDAEATVNESKSLAGGSTNTAALITKARDLVIAAVKERDAKLATNTRTFVWDLDVWLRSLKPLEKVNWEAPVMAMKASVKKDRVPTAEELGEVIKGQGLHPNIVKIHTYSISKQVEIDAGHELRCGKVRDAYAAKLKEMGAAAQASGQQDLTREIKDLLDDTSDLKDWIEDINPSSR